MIALAIFFCVSELMATSTCYKSENARYIIFQPLCEVFVRR